MKKNVTHQFAFRHIIICIGLLFCLFNTAAQVDVQATVQAGITQNTVDLYLQQQARAGKAPNSLIQQSSPYLLQHAYNPVHWYAWGEDAFAKAREQNKPVFLSIGYSTCHWCHVMAHESFENKKIADYLNKHFIAIKVDREERPDIDNVYMAATQLIHGSGGWPMTVFLDSHLRPFHAATYYPPFSEDGHTGLFQVLEIVHRLWQDEPQRIEAIAAEVTSRIKILAEETGDKKPVSKNIHEKLMKQAFISFDSDMGGFGAAPKFPKPGLFYYLNQQSKSAGKYAGQAEKMMELTLDEMAAGGIYDQLVGGFHRYSVDEQWRVPHFEKMLYGQALMVISYSDFYSVHPLPRYKEIVSQTLHFVEQEMQSPQGGFYSALDADSEKADAPGEHAEGAYYLWQDEELKTFLSKEEYAFFHDYYDIQSEGNIYSDPKNEFGQGNILVIAEAYRGEKLTDKQRSLLETASAKLNTIRLLRPRPHLDDKIITAWNGMMIKAMANAARVFPDKAGQYTQLASRTAGFVLAKLYRTANTDEVASKRGKLYRQYRAGKAGVAAGLNDYVWLINGLLALHEVTGNAKWLDNVVALLSDQDSLFFDDSSGAYFETANNDENILFRSKSIYDGALPSANAVAILNLKQLAKLFSGQQQAKQYQQKADNILQAFAEAINENPAATAMAISALVPVHSRHSSDSDKPKDQ